MDLHQIRAGEAEFIDSRPINIPPDLIRRVNVDCLALMKRQLQELREFETVRDQIDYSSP